MKWNECGRQAGVVAGIDSGLHSTKVVLLREGRPCTAVVVPAEMESAAAVAERALAMALAKSSIGDGQLARVVATGRGRSFISFVDESIPDFLCLATGIQHVLPSVHGVLEIGAEKSLAIKCSSGRVLQMASNDRCATGTGSYLQIVSGILQVALDEMGALSLLSGEDLAVNSTCAVFAESEIISLIHAKKKREDILRGVYRGLALRLHTLLIQAGIEQDVALVGGVALDVGLRRALEEQTGHHVVVPDDPLTVGALGAAIIAGLQAEERG